MTATASKAILFRTRTRATRWYFLLMYMGYVFVAPSLDLQSALSEVLGGAGSLLVAVGVFGRVFCSMFIGGRKNDQLIVSGPYSVVRNPLYVFSFIIFIGIGLQSRSLVLLVLFVLPLLAY